MMGGENLLPSQVVGDPSIFDRFADATSRFASRAPFFAGCVLLVLTWLPTFLFVRDFDTWQLLINTPTTIVTFLLVALLQNSQSRADKAVQHKLNAVAEALADLMDVDEHLDGDQDELRAAVGLERRETSTS